MTTKKGLQADQRTFLTARIWRGHLRKFRDAAKGNIHMPGVFVIEQLNGIFGHAGWSVDELRREERLRQEYENPSKPGTKQYRVVIATTVRLTILDTDGNELCHRDASGTWPGTGPQLSDAYNVADGGAWTAALKRAAMTLGPQFGLGTVRDAKDEGPQGSAVVADWRRATSDTRQPYPVSVHGDGIDPVTGYVLDEGDMLDDDGPQGTPTRQYEVEPRGEPQRQHERPQDRQPETQRQPQTSKATQTTPAETQRQTSPATAPATQATQPAQEHQSGGRKREDVARDAQGAIRTLTSMPGGRDAWLALFDRAKVATGKAALTPPMWAKPENLGGFTASELERLLSGVNGEITKLGGAA
jgi:hypothetical protein